MGVLKIEDEHQKSKGNKRLRKSLLDGDIKMISDELGFDYIQVFNCITGKYNADKSIVDAAKSLAGFYREIKLNTQRKKLIRKHGKLN